MVFWVSCVRIAIKRSFVYVGYSAVWATSQHGGKNHTQGMRWVRGQGAAFKSVLLALLATCLVWESYLNLENSTLFPMYEIVLILALIRFCEN